ncbi:MAG: tRNA (N6-isopentenyl adenosine(37)-C2)-methylthiotransferase MiaB, partial [Miltoncostaeaceae bacterium]
MPRYHLTTFGCQMNAHDSERMRGLLGSLGYHESPDRDAADLIVFNTCTIRGSADERFMGNLGEARRIKRERPDVVVAVGGCWAQSQKESV